MDIKSLITDSNIKKIAEIRAIYSAKSAKAPLIVIIEQIHHNFIQKKAKKELTEATNKLQKDIFKLLKELKKQDIQVLGVEDITYPDNLEVDEKEAAEMIKKSHNNNINTWYYEKQFPGDFKTYCVDLINICGIRKGVAFAGEKLLGEAKNLKLQLAFLKDYFQKNLIDIHKDEKDLIWQQINKQKAENPEISYLGLFFTVISMQITGVIEALGELFSAVKLTEHAKKQLKTPTKWEETDKTNQLISKIQEEFLTFTRKSFNQAEQNPSFEGFSNTFIKYIESIYKDAIAHTKDINDILNTLQLPIFW